MKRTESKEILFSHAIGDMTVCYMRSNASQRIGLRLVPRGMEGLCGEKLGGVEPLVQAKLAGDDFASGFGNGRTMRGSATVAAMKYADQQVTQSDHTLRIDTTLVDERGYRYIHHLQHDEGAPYVVAWTTFANDSASPVQLEMLSSFTLGELSYFSPGDCAGMLELYQMHSSWSAEGRIVHESVEHAHLEPSWSNYSHVTRRWGQVGSMPVREYAPFAAVEDKAFGVMWAVQLTHGASWQLEAGRTDEGFTLSGGLADREMGHWCKQVLPGGSFTTPQAILTVTMNGLEDACERLIAYTQDRLDYPESENDCPVLFNEFCTTWGTPHEDTIRAIVDAVAHLKLAYFMIDAGWYAQTPGHWQQDVGNWQVSPFLFSRGLEDTLDYIRAKGLKPGVWFELESVGRECTRFAQAEWMLKRDGVPITVGDRRFWDFRLPEVRQYLQERVIDFLAHYGFQYIKIDYNESLGIGVEGAESLGEGLQEQVLAVQAFFRELHRQLPHVVIELCSSGGHRLVPSFLQLCSMASFSDAHECKEIPIVASNMHRMIPVRQNQIWAVVHAQHTPAQLYYKLTAGFLGRLCLSGDVLALSREQWDVIDRCVAFSKACAPVIANGSSRRYGTESESWRHPIGWQAVVRTGKTQVLAVVHTFEQAPQVVRFPVPAGCEVEQVCARDGIQWALCADQLVITGLSDMDGLGILLNHDHQLSR